MSQLAAAIDADDELLTLDTLPPSPYVQIGDELIEIRARFPGGIYPPTQETLAPKIRVRRGQAGTTKASHAEDATLTPVYGFGAGGGGAGTLAEVLVEGNDTGGVDPGVGIANTVIISESAGPKNASVTTAAVATASADAFADRFSTSVDGDAHADTTATAAGIQDANARTTATTIGGNADVTRRAEATGAEGGEAVADTVAESTGALASANRSATASGDGNVAANTTATASGDGDASVYNEANATGAGTATAALYAVGSGGFAGINMLADAVSGRMAFYDGTPTAKPTGVAVTAEAIHAALVDLGLIAGP